MAPSEFWRCTVTEVILFMEGWREGQHERIEMDRTWTFLGLLPHVKKNSLKKPVDLIRFPWEGGKKKGQARMSKGEVNEMFKRIRQRDADLIKHLQEKEKEKPRTNGAQRS